MVHCRAHYHEAIFQITFGSIIALILFMCCTAVNNQMYIEPMLSAMFGMPEFNGADMAGIAFGVIGICAVLGSLVFPILIGSSLPLSLSFAVYVS